MRILRALSLALALWLLSPALAQAQPAPFNYPPAGGGGGSSSCSGDINAACSQVLGVGNVTTGTLGLGHGGTGQTTAATARGSAGLDIDALTGHGDSNYTILSTDRVVATNAAFTAARTWTLPAANSVNPGQSVTVADIQGTLTSTNTLTVARAGSDTIEGGSQVVLSTASASLTLVSDGASKWTIPASAFMGGTFVANDGSVTVGGANLTMNTTGGLHFNVNGWDFGSFKTSVAQVLNAGGATNNGLSVSPIAVTNNAETKALDWVAWTLTANGAIATQRFGLFEQDTVTASSAQTVTEADTVAIAGAPIAAGSATLAKSVALRVQGGNSLTSGATTGVGLKVDAPTGAGANKAAEFSGHVEVTGTAPTVSSCGTSPSIVGNDMVGRVTVGTSPSTTCTLTFNAAFTNAPICLAQDETTSVTMRATTVSTTAVTFTASGTLTASDKISYSCRGFF
jgi:hypothetical protein